MNNIKQDISNGVDYLAQIKQGNYDPDGVIIALSIDLNSYKDIANSQMQIIDNLKITLNDQRKMFQSLETKYLEIIDKKRILDDFNLMRNDFAIQMLASLVNASRANGTLPNADMMAVEAIKYADALIKALSKQE